MIKKYCSNSLTILVILCIFSTTNIYAQQPSGWVVEAKDIKADNYFGVTAANGMIGLVSSPEPMRIKEVVLNGVFDTYGRGRVSNILKGFNFADINMDVSGVEVNSNNISGLRQWLDMKEGVFHSTFNLKKKAKIHYQLRALRHLPYSILIEVEVEAMGEIEITPRTVIAAPEILQDISHHYQTIEHQHGEIPLLTSLAVSPSGKLQIAASNTFLFNQKAAPQFIHEDRNYDSHWLKFSKKLSKGEKYKFYVLGTTGTSKHFTDVQNDTERLTVYAALEGSERLIAKHKKAWADLWKGDIIVEGDLEAQRDIRFALYHLYAFVREGSAYSMSPMGLSGLGYNGHSFWDTELWMYPPLLMLHPEIAKSLLEYRFKHLDAAKANAFNHGYKGAMFPWESDSTGREVTPVWALTGPFEHHISGCVSWAFWKYYQVTKDQQWLEERGYPVLEAVANFWVSRSELGKNGQYHILNVVGADEYAENVDDNAFTNGVAKVALQYANQAAKILNKKPNPQWLEVADKLVFNHFPDGTTMEYTGYNGQIIKQADVNLLAFPLDVITDHDQIKKDLSYYEKVMDPKGPAMGLSVLSVLYNRLGETKKSFKLFKKSYKDNEVPPFGVLAETPGGSNPYFATAAGGMLQAVMTGFAGLTINDKGIEKSVYGLPKKWQSLTIKGVGLENKTYIIKHEKK